MLQQRLHFRQYARAIGRASPPPLVTLLFFNPCILVECIRHELLKGGEEQRVVSHSPVAGWTQAMRLIFSISVFSGRSARRSAPLRTAVAAVSKSDPSQGPTIRNPDRGRPRRHRGQCAAKAIPTKIIPTSAICTDSAAGITEAKTGDTCNVIAAIAGIARNSYLGWFCDAAVTVF